MYASEIELHCFCVMARVRKVMKAATAKAEKITPTPMKNLRPLSQVRQKSWRYMMCVTRAQSAKTPAGDKIFPNNVPSKQKKPQLIKYHNTTEKR